MFMTAQKSSMKYFVSLIYWATLSGGVQQQNKMKNTGYDIKII